MTAFAHSRPTLLATLWPAEPHALRNALCVVAGSLILWASAKVQVPFYPVPMTMQTTVIFLIGMTMGWRLGVATVLLYLAEGAIGLTVFAGTPEKGIGIAYMMGPTGGYLFGFVLAAALTGWLAERGWDRRPTLTFAAMVGGNLAIYAPGLLWLGALLGWDKPILEWGLMPFLLGDVTKALLAAAVLPGAWWCIVRRRSDEWS